jgi:hypothetical protein
MEGGTTFPSRDTAPIDLLGDPWSMLVLRDVIFGRSSA